MENVGHLAGMLDRDQRTAKLRFFSDKQVAKTYSFSEKTVNESSSNPNRNISHRHCCSPARTKSSNSSYLTLNNGYLLRNFQRFTNVLIVGVCLTLVTLPSTSSAPADLMSERMKKQPKWIDPCEVSSQVTESPPDHSPVTDRTLLRPIRDQARIAYNNANVFKDEFVDKTFHMPFHKVHDIFKDDTWLNLKLPKSLGKDVPKEVLDTLNIDETLLDVYGFLQTVAVGLEQVVWDQEDNHGDFKEQFARTEHELRNVLCEIQMVLIERGVKMRPDVTRDIMKDNDRRMSTVRETQTRDWKIFRDYLNILEYTIAAFTHFLEV